MKATLTFDLDIADDREAFRLVNQAPQMATVLVGIGEIFRKYIKYDHTFASADDCLEKLREEILELRRDHNIVLD